MPLADRFAQYVSELHELSDNHRISHGKPEDLSRLVEAVQKSKNFAEEFGSVMRSIAIREQFRLSESEYLTLVAAAWTGTAPDESAPQFSDLFHELGGILHKALAQRVLSHRVDPPIVLSTEAREVSSDLPDGNRELEIKPDVQVNRQLPNTQDRQESQFGAINDPVLAQRGSYPVKIQSTSWGGTPQEPEPNRSIQRFRFQEAEMDLSGIEGKSRSLDDPLSRDLGATGETVRTRVEPSLAEVLAVGLAGLVIALLFNAGSLPIYRARVSVYLPSTSEGAPRPGSRNESLLNGELTEKVAERLLAWPEAKPILRQDVVSRGMRDLHLGGNETILYADLVSETARQIKVMPLQEQNLYAITCDSWSAEFAATFCNELTASLDDSSSGAISSQENPGPARVIDAALQPGIQVYPRWYLQGTVGLSVGLLVGLLASFFGRPTSNPTHDDDIVA
jgi:hypothetical protein